MKKKHNNNESKESKTKQFYRGKSVLVTGGCGFIGSHLVQQLVSLGAEVTVLDNLSTGFLNNIKNVKNNIKFLRDTIVNKAICNELTRGKDIIFHLAAMISVPETIEKPGTCHQVNVDGIVNLLEAARLNNVERFIFSSSAAVYGNCKERSIETMPCNPTSPYGFSKYIGELYCREYAHLYGIKTVSLRYFNVFGSRQNTNGAYAAVYAAFNERMKNNERITIFGDGKQTRDFIPVERVVQANVLMAMQEKNIMNGQVFNIAIGKSITLLELIEKLRQSYPSYNEKIIFEPARPGDLAYSCADCSKYRKICELYR